MNTMTNFRWELRTSVTPGQHPWTRLDTSHSKKKPLECNELPIYVLYTGLRSNLYQYLGSKLRVHLIQ